MSKIQQYLEAFKSKDNITHTAYGAFNGMYSIPGEKLPELYKYLMFSVNTEKIPVGLVERPPADGVKQFLIDLDLLYNKETEINQEHIIKFISILSAAIKKYTNHFENNEKIRFYIQTRDTGYFSKDIYKNGIHIIITDFITNIDTQHFIRDEILEHNNLQDLFLTTNKSFDIFDKSVISSNGFFLYGCGKEEQPPYRNKYIYEYDNKLSNIVDTKYNIKLDKINVPTITLLSQRKTYNLEKIALLKEEYKNTIQEVKKEIVKSVIKPIIKLKSKSATNFIKQLSDAESAEYIFLLNNINTDRFDTYSDWLKIAILLKQSGVNYHYFDLFSQYSSKYNKEECFTFWNNLDVKDVKEKITIATLYQWFKEDSELEFTDFKDNFNNVLEITNHIEIANLYYRLVKDNNKLNKYIYDPTNNQWYYLKPDNIWVCSGRSTDPDTLKEDIYGVLENLFERELKRQNAKKSDINNELTDLLLDKVKNKNKSIISKQSKLECEEKLNAIDKRMKMISKVIVKIGTSKECHQIIDYLRSKYTNHKITINHFNKPTLFAFNNMLIDFNKFNIRSIEPEDYIMNTTGFDYKEEENLEQQNEIIEFFKSLFDSEELYEFFMKKIARCLNGNIEGNHLFNIYTGSARNGKSLSFNFIKNALGSYFVSVKSDLLTSKIKDADRANPSIYSLIGKRMAIISEIEDEISINTAVIKSITGGDTLTGRKLYCNDVSFKPQCHLGILCNVKPVFKDSSNAMDLRNNVINYPFTFGDIEDGHFKKLADNDIQTRLFKEEYYLAFLHILIKIYKTQYMNDLTVRDIPNDVKEQTKNYNEENDPISNWFNDKVGITKNASDKIKSKELYELFTNDTGNKISQISFNNTMKNKLRLEFKKCRDANYFINIKFKVEIVKDITECLLNN